MIWLALTIGVALYWLTRYQRELSSVKFLGFVEYALAEWRNLLWGALGAVLLYVLYVHAAPEVLKVAARKWAFLDGVVIPAINFPIAALLGFAGKNVADRLPRVVNWFGANIRLPWGK